MLRKLLKGLLGVLYWLTGFALFNLFVGIIVSPFERSRPVSLVESTGLLESSITGVISLRLSLLLFYLVWRFPRLERWKGHMNLFALISGCLVVFLSWLGLCADMGVCASVGACSGIPGWRGAGIGHYDLGGPGNQREERCSAGWTARRA
jgi:hypothetical protein